LSFPCKRESRECRGEALPRPFVGKGGSTNKPYGDNHRNGAVKDRSQTHNPHNDRWMKRDSDTGRFIDQKSDKEPFKGVRKER
jgi:hypothetical protein